MDRPICVECQHYAGRDICARKRHYMLNLVTGGINTLGEKRCDRERSRGFAKCGPTGRFFHRVSG